MPVNDSIAGLANSTIDVKRRVGSTFVGGKRVLGSLTTYSGVVAVVQPAFNLNRVIGGSNLDGGVENQSVVTIYQIHTTFELKSRTQTTEPDVVTLAGGDYADGEDYTVARVEHWSLDGENHYHAVITKQTGGAS